MLHEYYANVKVEFQEESEEWKEGICSVTCPECGGTLSMTDDHATLIEPNKATNPTN